MLGLEVFVCSGDWKNKRRVEESVQEKECKGGNKVRAIGKEGWTRGEERKKRIERKNEARTTQDKLDDRWGTAGGDGNNARGGKRECNKRGS